MGSSKAHTDQGLEEYMVELAAQKMAEEIDRDMMHNIIWEATLKNNATWHLVQLKWEKGKDTAYFWNEACAWAVENFGLPGDNYVTHPTENHMDFLFKNEKDAILMTLKWI